MWHWGDGSYQPGQALAGAREPQMGDTLLDQFHRALGLAFTFPNHQQTCGDTGKLEVIPRGVGESASRPPVKSLGFECHNSPLL